MKASYWITTKLFYKFFNLGFDDVAEIVKYTVSLGAF